jgi:hypothetical protein
VTPTPVIARAVALCLFVLTVGVGDAAAEAFDLRRLDPALFRDAATLAAMPPASSQAQTSERTCRRGRRAWIGALVGAGTSIPLAVILHERWINEGKNGDAGAASTVALGAAGGAPVGMATCS